MNKDRSFLLPADYLRWRCIVLLFILICLSAVSPVSAKVDMETLAKKNPGATALMDQRLREARKKGEMLEIQQTWVDFEEIPELLKKTVLVSEDLGFYRHNGIDGAAIEDALKRNLEAGKVVRGGSTITQQLAKNLFLSNERTLVRKMREALLARQLEDRLSKDRIFHLYLNIIELGKGIFGVEAAAQFYFNKPVDRLTLEEIVRLAAVIPKPLKVKPVSQGKYLRWRANLLLDRLIQFDFITIHQYTDTKDAFREHTEEPQW